MQESGSPRSTRRWKLLAVSTASPLIALLGLPAASEVDMLDEATAASYWERSDRFDMALDLTAGRRGLVALGDVIRRWLSHLLAIDVAVEPVSGTPERPMALVCRIDSEATRVGDAHLERGDDLDEETRSRLVGIFSADVPQSGRMIEKVQRRAGISVGGDDD